ncbi:MAG: hypothetical protein M0Q91_12600 [Methanoregula sp.]|jgi:hypothetical protein|nr:hypothetical protein [Methanoregula sp.]
MNTNTNTEKYWETVTRRTQQNKVYWEKMGTAMNVMIAKGWTTQQCWDLINKYAEKGGYDETHILKIVEAMRIYI